MTEPGVSSILEVENLEKVFYLRSAHTPASIKEKALGTFLAGRGVALDRVAALQGITFQVAAGEGVGVVGDNGAGKTTLLKLIAGVYEPSGGTIRVGGRMISLLGLGTGFHSDLTGRENIFLNASIYGLQNREIRNLVPAIADFSELADWLNRPIKIYSAGMVGRLAFSIAAHLNPEVLLLDEIFSVGDLRFQRKSEEKIKEMKKAGVTIMASTHQTVVLEALCDRVLYLKAGRLEAFGPMAEVLQRYVSAAASEPK